MTLASEHPFAVEPAIAVTGLGLVTPLGMSAWSTFAALLAGRTLTDRCARLPRSIDPLTLVRSVGCVASAVHASTDPSIDLAERAAREAIFEAGLTAGELARTPCFLGMSKGAMHAWEQTVDSSPTSMTPRRYPDAAGAVTMGPVGFVADHLRTRLGLGSVRGVVAACASSLTALHLARLHLLSQAACGLASEAPLRAIVITSEAALFPVLIHSYRRLGVLPTLTPGEYRQRPLDKNRRGFVLAEQAAAVVLEGVRSGWEKDSEPRRKSKTRSGGLCDAKSDIRHPKLLLTSTAIASEGYDLMRPAPEMPALRHVARSIFSRGPTDVLHPHATGTQDNDEAELEAYAAAIQSEIRNPNAAISGGPAAAPPRVYAVKGALGHGLGAAGLVSLVVAGLMARTGKIPPMPWLVNPVDSPFRPTLQPSTLNPSSSAHAVFAAGFGGHVAGARLECVGEEF